ncbi:Small-conductance mechanosensitive channel [Saccharicrinis carchari]|uniref:Small-conductance mechanosensitive channel n=1 Tax=Saccharicrinis carchari TaxID=1168039 RepID=A0A521BYS1_SACCC|nr:mechanosensitive ion channel domain-containing protein [Saccharicrinis carchari]SMO52332.1 Small-conductance mechanosensitive channel [Saccharicrinis carchari]
MIAKIISIALIIFLLFRLLFSLKNKWGLSVKIKRHLAYILPIAELFVWIGYLIWAVRLIYLSQNYFTLAAVGIVLLVLCIPLYLLLRDFIVGNVLKMQNKVNEGVFIEIEEIKGRIKRAGYFRLDIEDNRGNINSIPYNHIRSKIISQYGINQNLAKVVLRFTFPDTTKVNYIVPLLKRQILNTPWAAVSQDPIVEKTKTENGKLIIEVGTYTLDKSYGENIKNCVDKQFSLSYYQK